MGMLVLAVAAVVLMPEPALAKSECLRIVRQGDIETLVNRCDVCRVASMIRSRPGSQVPVSRRFNVQPHSTFPVPFRGPGRTRLTSDFPCPGEPGGDKDLLDQKSTANEQDEQKCVSMERSTQVGLVLVNRCGTCRAVAVERYTADGAGRARAYVMVSGGSSVPVNANGFARVGVLAEIPCP